MGDFQYDRLDSLLKKNGTTRKYLCLSAGHADNYIRGFEKRGKEPPREFVKYCADKLGTTTAYLYGETDDSSPVPAPAAPEQKEKPNALDGIELEKLSPARRALLEALDGMTEENIMKLVRIAQAVKMELPE